MIGFPNPDSFGTPYPTSRGLAGKYMAYITECLRDPDVRINDIVKQAGYGNISTFRKAFKRHFGMNLTAYRIMRYKD